MKKTIIYILISTLLFSCNRCPPSSAEVDPKDPILFFSIIDGKENDLFFGEESKYDPQKVEISNAPGETSNDWQLMVDEERQCFKIWIDQGKTSILYVEFIPGRVEKMKIESRFLRWYEEKKGCRLWGIYKNDFFINNNVTICTDCPLESYYKIKI